MAIVERSERLDVSACCELAQIFVAWTALGHRHHLRTSLQGQERV
jgi:hypothetical protein